MHLPVRRYHWSRWCASLRPSSFRVDSAFTGCARAQEMWSDVVYNPDNWFDNREGNAGAANAGSKRPDFKRKSDGAALWLCVPLRANAHAHD